MLKVLVIEDDESARLSIVSFLEDMDYNVYEAESGEVGIKIIKDTQLDIVLTDTHMPGLSGIDVLYFIKENNPELPAIVISGAGEVEYVVEALRAGAWDYITKPIVDLDILIHAINQAFKKADLIRENKEKSYELEKTNRALESSLKELKDTQKQLIESEKMASLGYMGQRVALEINTPLGVCMTSTSYIKDRTNEIIKLNDERKMKIEDFKHYTDNNQNLTEILFDSLQSINKIIVDFKQLTVEPSEMIRKKFCLNDSISSMILFVTSSYPGIKISTEFTGEIVNMDSYAELINRIFIKLTENCVHHAFKGRESGKIFVDVKKEDGNIIVKFRNNGHEIPKEYYSKFFDPFFTSDKKKRTGLGLCIVYNLVVFTFNGSISFTSSDDGVEFKLTFPIDS